MNQLVIPFATGQQEDGEGEWTYFFGVPKRPGVLKYTHLIRSSKDPKERMGHGAGVRDPAHWRHGPDVRRCMADIRKLMSDGKARTFNAICVEITGTTADIWFEKEPDTALWKLVELEELGWAHEEGAIFFLDSKFIKRDT